MPSITSASTHGETSARCDATPQVAHPGGRIGAILQPRIQDADDQHRLCRFAPYDEQCVAHWIGRYFATTLPWPVFSWNSSKNLYSPAFKRVDRQRRLLAGRNHLLLLQFAAFEFHCRLALVAHLEAEPLACRHFDRVGSNTPSRATSLNDATSSANAAGATSTAIATSTARQRGGSRRMTWSERSGVAIRRNAFLRPA